MHTVSFTTDKIEKKILSLFRGQKYLEFTILQSLFA